MPKTIEHARSVVEYLAGQMQTDGVIPEVDATTLMKARDLKASAYAVAYGQAISMLDAACLQADVPWLGRLVGFKRKRSDLTGCWAQWQPHMEKITSAPKRKRWSKSELASISAALPAIGGATKWWRNHESQSELLLQRALKVAEG